MQLGMYFDQTRCNACFTCIVACKDWHDIPAGPASWLRVSTFEKGSYPNIFVAHLVSLCFHCLNPACVAACPASALTKCQSDGVVVVDSTLCLGHDKCDMCLQACPYDAPQFGTENNAKMQKCDFCLDRLMEHKQPICVAACPMRAMDFGPIEQLQAKYDAVQDAEGFTYCANSSPSVVFRPRKDMSNLPLARHDLVPLTAFAKQKQPL